MDVVLCSHHLHHHLLAQVDGGHVDQRVLVKLRRLAVPKLVALEVNDVILDVVRK